MGLLSYSVLCWCRGIKKLIFLVRLVSRFSLSHVGSEEKIHLFFDFLVVLLCPMLVRMNKKFNYSVPCWCREIKIHLFVATN